MREQPADSGGPATLWCAGLPHVETLTMAGEDCERLAEMIGRESRRPRPWIAASVLLVVGMFALGAFGRPESSAGSGLLTIGLILLLVVLPCTILVTRDAVPLVKGLRRDMASGELLRFSGPVLPGTPADMTTLRLRRSRLMPPAADQFDLEVLPASRRVWRAGGRVAPSAMRAVTTLVAEPPEFARLAAEWMQPADGDSGRRAANERALGGAEQAEIRRKVAVLGNRLGITGMVLLGWLVWAALALGPRRGPDGGHVVVAALLCLMTWRRSQLAMRQYRLLKQFGSDLRVGKVAIMALPDDAPGGRRIVEVLAASRSLWRDEGRPAAWRTIEF